MRRGFTLVEMLVVIILLPFVFVALDGLFVTLLGEIPRAYYISQESVTLQHLLAQMQRDVDKATGLPESFAGHTANDSQVLIELPEGVVCYEKKDGKIVRRELSVAGQSAAGGERVWPLPHTKVQWQVLSSDGRRYAIEVTTYIEYKTSGRWHKTMANSHLFYGGVLK
jgi:prepilin-type N-terminal cleavage/methylation domain-containing protein